MAVLVSGSLAFDTILEHEGSIGGRLAEADLEHLNATFLAPRLRVSRGGCAGNIAVAMRRLGGDPLPWGAVGEDGGPYLEALAREGIRTEGIVRLSGCLTARCVILTDADGAQLSAFHPGAIERGTEAPWPVVAGSEARPRLAVLSPAGRTATLRAARECRLRNVPFLLDVGQELPLFSKDELLALSEDAFGIAFSDFEAEEFARLTSHGPEDLARNGRFVLVTHGARGASFWEPGKRLERFVEALPVEARSVVGAGDAMRGGLLLGLERGLGFLEAVRLGTVAAAAKVRGTGAQDYALTPCSARADYEAQWGTAPFPDGSWGIVRAGGSPARAVSRA